MSLFYRSILGHMWEKSWPWTTLDPAHVAGVERAKRDHQRKAARHGGSQELTEKLRARRQSKWILLVLQVSWGLWGQELFRELLMYLMSEGKLYTPVSQREPVSDCISFFQVRKTLLSVTFSLFPLLTPVSPSILHWREETDWGEGGGEAREKIEKKLNVHVQMWVKGNFNFKLCSFEL